MSNQTLIIPNNVNAPRSDGLFQSILDAYSKLADHPLALIIFILTVLAIIAEYNNQQGPFEIILDTLENYNNNKNHPAFFRTLAAFLIGILKFLVRFKSKFFNLLLLIIIPFVYVDRNVSWLVLFYGFFIIVSTINPLIILLITQLLFIYYSLTRFSDKLIIFIIILYCLIGSENLSLMFTPMSNRS